MAGANPRAAAAVQGRVSGRLYPPKKLCSQVETLYIGRKNPAEAEAASGRGAAATSATTAVTAAGDKARSRTFDGCGPSRQSRELGRTARDSPKMRIRLDQDVRGALVPTAL